MVLFLCAVFALCAAGEATAQSGSPGWTKTISTTGTTVVSGIGYSSPSAWASTSEGASTGGGINPGSSLSVTLNGTVKYSFDWNGGAANVPPPQQVVLRTSGTANWQRPLSNSTGAGSPNATGDKVETSSSATSQTKTAYSVVDGTSGHVEATVTLECHATGNATYSDPNSRGFVYAAAGASASLWSVEMTTGGTLKSGTTERILIGQRCDARLNLNGNVSPANTDESSMPVRIDQSSYYWVVTGDIFDRFDVSSDEKIGKMVTCEEADTSTTSPTLRWLKDNPTWYWRKEGGAAIYGSAKIQRSSDGSLINSSLVITEVSVKVPIYNLFVDEGNTGWDASEVDPIQVTSATYQNGQPTKAGKWFSGAVGTPADFRRTSGDWPAGYFYYTQLISPARALGGSPVPNWNSADYALDNFPIYFSLKFPADSANLFLNRNSGDTTDSPYHGLGQYNSVSTGDRFQMFLVYLPPDTGLGVQPVVLSRVRWAWNTTGSATRDSMNRRVWTPAPYPGTVTHEAAEDVREHPRWNKKLTNASGILP